MNLQETKAGFIGDIKAYFKKFSLVGQNMKRATFSRPKSNLANYFSPSSCEFLHSVHFKNVFIASLGLKDVAPFPFKEI